MDQSVTFWLDNRKCAGIKAAAIGDQQLILYRDRYYVVTGGAAQTRAGKPLRFSTTSLPSAWKLALKGETPLPSISLSVTEPPPPIRKTEVTRKKTEKPAMIETPKVTVSEQDVNTPAPAVKQRRTTEAKAATQPPVTANCPYCTTRHEIPLEKGKSGKPFFVSCIKCTKEFAVRFVQVTMYQAQVAGFK